jgi:hypothetical protein
VAGVAATAVLKNNVVVGSVNANKRHGYKAGHVLASADRAWLARLVAQQRESLGGVHTRCLNGSLIASGSSFNSRRHDYGTGGGRGAEDPSADQAFAGDLDV